MNPRGRPAFVSSREGNELWMMVLEKAYSKYHGSFDAIEGGFVHIGLVDFTGGSGEDIRLTGSMTVSGE